MTVEADITSVLSALVANQQVYPDVAPQGITGAYVTYQQVGGAGPGTFMDRQLPSKQHGRFQVTVWTTTRLATAALALQIEAAMVAATAFVADTVGGPVAVHDPDTNLYGSRQDFSIWSDR